MAKNKKPRPRQPQLAHNELPPPPVAFEDPRAKEILRLWVDGDESACQVVIHPYSQDPCVWGLLLVDVVRHLGNVYARQGMDPKLAMGQIKEILDAEWAHPTDSAVPWVPKDTDKPGH